MKRAIEARTMLDLNVLGTRTFAFDAAIDTACSILAVLRQFPQFLLFISTKPFPALVCDGHGMCCISLRLDILAAAVKLTDQTSSRSIACQTSDVSGVDANLFKRFRVDAHANPKSSPTAEKYS